MQGAADDVGDPGDLVKVATGRYTGVAARKRAAQVVYISKTVTIQGGYSITDWDTADPKTNPTTLDAEGQGRALYIARQMSDCTLLAMPSCRVANVVSHAGRSGERRL